MGIIDIPELFYAILTIFSVAYKIPIEHRCPHLDSSDRVLDDVVALVVELQLRNGDLPFSIDANQPVCICIVKAHALGCCTKLVSKRAMLLDMTRNLAKITTQVSHCLKYVWDSFKHLTIG